MKKYVTDADVKKLLEKLSPDQRAVAETLAGYKVQCAMLTAQNEALKKDHADLYKIMVVLLDANRCAGMPEMRIHESQFLRFNESYRIDRRFDAETKEVVLKLMYVTDVVEGTPKLN